MQQPNGAKDRAIAEPGDPHCKAGGQPQQKRDNDRPGRHRMVGAARGASSPGRLSAKRDPIASRIPSRPSRRILPGVSSGAREPRHVRVYGKGKQAERRHVDGTH